MRRRMLALALSVGVVVSLLGASVQAVDLTRPVSLTVSASGEEYAEDIAAAQVVTDLYFVASAEKTAGYDSYSYTLAPGFETLTLPETTASESGSETWETVSNAAAELALAEGSTLTPVVRGVPAGERMENLTPGLYLLVARGAEEAEYVTRTADETGTERLVTVANSNEYTYTFAPELVSLPGKAPDENGVVSTANPGEWLYDVTGQLKPERDYRYGTLEIVKGLDVYEDSSPATFVFRVTAELNGEEVYNNVVGLSFTAPGEKSTLVERLPVGATVTVTEIYSGSSYTLTTEESQTAEIAANSVVTVHFANTYDWERKRGYGVVNEFRYGADGWTVQQEYPE